MSAFHGLLSPLLLKYQDGNSPLKDVIVGHISGCSSAAVSDVVDCGVDCLNLFVQLNWTGPPDEDMELELKKLLGPKSFHTLNLQALAALSSDGEVAYKLCTLPLLLHVSNIILLDSRLSCEGEPLFVKQSAMRCLFVQQKLLEIRSYSLWAKLSELVKGLEALMASIPLTQEEKGKLYLELGYISLHYLQYNSAKLYFDKCLELAHVSVELTGALGKRTKFQQTHLAQLVLKVSVCPSHGPEVGVEDGPSHAPEVGVVADLPREVSLDDATVLDQVNFTEPRSVEPLSPLQQATLLAQCIYQKKTKAADRLSIEEIDAYLNCVLHMPQCWVVQNHALFMRASLEKQKYSVQQRNMQQLEELVGCFHRELPKASSRLSLFYSVPACPLWVIQKELAGVLVRLGCLNSAVEVLSQLELWEELAAAYQAIGRKGKAKELVQGLLDTEPTPTLLCLMGDITQDADYYRQAWELSDSHSSRAQRSLGLWYLRREQYEESIQSLQKSLAINSLQDGLWFSLGCAASRAGQTELSIEAWHRTVALEPDFAEAWNNLAGAYLKKKEKARAQRIFQEALRCSYDNQKIWENFLLVSTELHLWKDCLRAYHRLLELDSKFLDVEVLGVLVAAVTEGFPEKSTAPAVEHRSVLGQLLGRITACGKVPANVWKFYADFHLSSTDEQDHSKGVEDLQKAQRVARLQSGWEKQIEGVKMVAHLTLSYSRASRQLYDCESKGSKVPIDKKKAVAGLSSAKLSLQGVISKAKGFGVTCDCSVEEIIMDLETEVKAVLKDLTQFIEIASPS